ncbi:unnamed protein product, partial [Discosporangium mesarthrocarpum]
EKSSSVGVCIVTWNLAETSPSLEDVQFLQEVAGGSEVLAIGVQEVENLKPRRHEGRRSREWRHLLNRTLVKDFLKIGHHAMGAMQLSLFARKEVASRVKVCPA